MPVNFDLNSLNELSKAIETATPSVEPDKQMPETFEQRALYWVNVANRLFTSVNELIGNVTKNPAIAKQLSDRFGFQVGQGSSPQGDTGLPSSVPAPVQQPQQQQQEAPLYIFMRKFLEHLLNLGYGKKTINDLFKEMFKKVEDSGMGIITIGEFYELMVGDKNYLNNMLKKFTEKKNGKK